MGNILLGLFLVGHGIIHLGYLTSPPDDPKYPFRLSQSWLITRRGFPAAPVAITGTTLGLIAVIGFAMAALAKIGILPAAWDSSLIAISAVASMSLLLLAWHQWLVLGVIINLVLLATTLL